MSDDPDDTSRKIPPPAVIAGKLRRHLQNIEDRDGSTYARRRPEPDHPVEVHGETTDVHELQRRTHERLSDEDEQARRVASAIVAVMHEHQSRGEMRSADRDLLVAAGKPPTAAPVAVIWWVKAIQAVIKVAPYVVSVGGVLVAAVIWLNDTARASEREAGDLRARLVQIERDIESLRRSQEWLWRRVNPDPVPVFPAMPGASHD